MRPALALIFATACAVRPTAGVDASPADARPAQATPDADPSACAVFGAPGECEDTTACTGDHTAYAGHCAGPANIQCCIVTPNVANNPPVPAGYKLMTQSEVTPAMTSWAVTILHDPATYPMFSTTTMAFGAKTVLARVEWHPPDFNNGAVHRGVTLYEPQ